MMEVPSRHPRAGSLRIRKRLIKHLDKGVVAKAGLIAHGRGEAFDYILGEKTNPPALKAIKAAAATMLLARKPVISVNGNAAALAAEEIVKLSRVTNAKIEVNLFYRSLRRELAIKRILTKAGADVILGVGKDASAQIPEIYSERRRVDPRGILNADVILVPLEDGDRTEGLRKIGKKVISIDLNPFSRTAQKSSITIVDNIVRAIPLLIEEVGRLKVLGRSKLKEIVLGYNNREVLGEAIRLINQRLMEASTKVVVPLIFER